MIPISTTVPTLVILVDFRFFTVRDVYQHLISVLYPYNGTCVYLNVYDWVTASYTVPQPTYALSKTVPVRHVRPWNGVYTARDSPGQPHMIVVIYKKLLKFERGHRATRWCNMVGIQRIYDMFTCPRLSCPTLECRIYSTGQSRTATCDRCGTPKAAEVQEGS